jgi:hypothetical protein
LCQILLHQMLFTAHPPHSPRSPRHQKRDSTLYLHYRTFCSKTNSFLPEKKDKRY